MSTVALYMRVWRSLSENGAWGAVRGSIANWLRSVKPARKHKHPFDRKYRVNTDGLMYAPELSTGHRHDVYSAGYYASAPSLIHGAIRQWGGTLAGTGFTLSDYTLLDIGCGKGRVVLLGTEYAFREVVGVELNAGLAQVARKNLRRWLRKPRACRNARIVHDDVLSIPFPEGPVAIYFFNPFECEMVELLLARLVNLAAVRQEPIDLIYVHPEFGELVRRTAGMAWVADAEVAFSEEDARADAFGVSSDRCAVFRLWGRP
jgi:SAM-dependent methyltransferase